MKTRGQKRDRKQPDMFVAVPASGKRPRSRRNKDGGGKTTKTKTEAKAKAKTVAKVAKRGKGRAVVDGAAACAAAAKAGRSTASRGKRDKQAHAQTVITNNSKPVQQRKKRGPYKKRKKQSTTTAAAKKAPADTTASSKASRKRKNNAESADVDDDESSISSSSSSSSSSTTDKARSAQSIGEISVQSNTRAKRTSTGSASKSPSFAPVQIMPVIDDADKVTVGGASGASSSSALLPQSPIALGSPTRLSISKLQSPLRSPGFLRLPASTAAVAASTGRSVGTGPSPGKQPKRHRPGCIPQFLGEDILCDTGLAFLPPDYDDPDTDETLDHWRAKYENGPGVSRAQMTSSASKATGRSRQYARRGSSGSVGSSGSAGGSGGTSGSNTVAGSSSDYQRYKSVVRYNGAPINLGTHRTSAAALAMQDLADLALLGSEHDKKMQLLSRDEAWMALHTAKLPSVHPYRQVDQFSELFSAKYKPIFEEKMEDALASIGGQDDVLAEVLCSLDNETQRQAEAADASVADQLNRVGKYKEKQVARRARRTEKLLKKHLAVKPWRAGPTNAPRFQKDHGIYGVGDDGNIFWFRIKDHAEVRQREIIMREHRNYNSGATNEDGEKSMDGVESSDNFAPDLGDSQHCAIVVPTDGTDAFDDQHDEDSDHEEADGDDGSMVSTSSSGDSSSAASSISSAASGDRSGKVRIVPFDDDEAASANKQQNLKAHNRETRAPGIPDAITITSTNVILSEEEKGETAATETIEPAESANLGNNEANEMNLNLPPKEVRDLLVSSALAPNRSLNSADSDLQRVHAILSEFDVSPLLSFSPSGMKLSKCETTGKTLTGIKFTRKGCSGGGGSGFGAVNEFIIDVRVVNNQAGNKATPILKLR